jgi:hypothetical protein
VTATVPLVVGGVVSCVAIAGATVALCLGHIDAGTYGAIVGTFGGGGLGVAAHAAGVKA